GPITVQICRGKAHASTEAGIISIELAVRNQRAPCIEQAVIKEDANICMSGLPGGVRAGDDIRFAVSVHVRNGNDDACLERGRVGQKVIEHGAVYTGEDFDLGGAARALIKAGYERSVDVYERDLDPSWRGNDIGNAIAIHVRDCHPNASAERGLMSVEVQA